MYEKNGSNKIDIEADILIELAALLKKERSLPKQEEVIRIYQSLLSTGEKAAQIRLIDEKPDQPAEERDSGPDEEDLDTEKSGRKTGEGTLIEEKNRKLRTERYFGTSPSTEEVPVNRKKRIRKDFTLKHQFQRSGYFSFLFRYYRDMKEFGYSSKTMVPMVFPPGLKIDRNVKTALEISIKPMAREIAVILNQLMGNSWLFLKKKEYNLLVILIELCNSIETTNFTVLDFSDLKVIDRLKEIEKLFLLLQYRKEYIDIIRKSINFLLENNRRSIRRLEVLPGMISKLMGKNDFQPSLFNTFLAVNMVKHRRFLTFNDLIISRRGELIETKEFDCSPETEDKIRGHIKKLKIQLEALEKEQKEILKVRTYLQKDNSNNVNLEPLITFYEKGDPSGKATFSADKNKLHSFLQQFSLSFLSVFENLLSSKVRISDLGKVSLFEGDPFRKELSRLQMTVSKCEDLNFQLPSFTKKRYLEITQKHLQAIQLEAEAVSLVDEVLSAVFSIADRLVHVLQSSSIKQIVGYEEFKPIIPGFTEHRSTSLPLGNLLKETGTYLKGSTVGEALSSIVAVSYLFGFYFNNRNMLNILRRENQVDHDMKAIIEVIERIAPLDVYKDIREQFNI